MSAVLMKDRPSSEVCNSDALNRRQIRRAIAARVGRMAEMPVVPRRELLRVLIVDAYRDSADTMVMLVDRWGHDVRQAYDGTTGMALAAAFQPDVMLFDIVVPEICGLELARQVRRLARLNDCLLVAVTGLIDAGRWLQCEEAGVDLVLIKPLTPSLLRMLLTVESEYRLQSQHDTAKCDMVLKTL